MIVSERKEPDTHLVGQSNGHTQTHTHAALTELLIQANALAPKEKHQNLAEKRRNKFPNLVRLSHGRLALLFLFLFSFFVFLLVGNIKDFLLFELGFVVCVDGILFFLFFICL